MAATRINIISSRILATVSHMKSSTCTTSASGRCFSVTAVYDATDPPTPIPIGPSSTHHLEKSETNSFAKHHNSSTTAEHLAASSSIPVHSSELRNTSGTTVLSSLSGSPIHDVRREMSSTGVSSDKPPIHILKTTFDQALTGTPADDVSLLASRRVDPSTVRQVYYFDTLAFTKKLESSGFTREQAEGCAECLVEIINTTLDHQGKHMVTKPQQEIAVQQLMSEIISVKKDMTLLQKSEFSSLKTETEKMSIELTQIQGHMNDEIVKLKGQFSLDINLERGRAIEAHAENEKRLQQLHNKIDTEIANLKTIYEIYRNDVFKYAGGTVIAVGTLMLGVIRLWH